MFLRNAGMRCPNSCKHHVKVELTFSGISWCPVVTVCLWHCFSVSSWGEIKVGYGVSIKKIRELFKILCLPLYWLSKTHCTEQVQEIMKGSWASVWKKRPYRRRCTHERQRRGADVRKQVYGGNACEGLHNVSKNIRTMYRSVKSLRMFTELLFFLRIECYCKSTRNFSEINAYSLINTLLVLLPNDH